MNLLKKYIKYEYSLDTLEHNKSETRASGGLTFWQQQLKIGLLALFLTFSIIFSSSIISADDDPTAEPFSIKSANSFGSVHNDNDILLITRYELPEANWYPYLKRQDGCTSQTPSTTIYCTYPNTLSSTIAVMELQYVDGSQVTIPNTPVVIRTIGDTMVGIYITGTSFTYETIANNKNLCIKLTNSAGTQSTTCSAISVPKPNTSAETTFTMIAELIQTELADIEIDQNYPPGTLLTTNNQKVTGPGVNMVRSISSELQTDIPELFEFGTYKLFDDISTPGPPGLEADIQAIATQTSVFHAAGEVGQAYFGMSPGVFINSMFFLMAIFAALSGFALSGNAYGAGIGFISVISTTLFLNSSMLSYVLVSIIVLAIFTSLWIVRKGPN